MYPFIYVALCSGCSGITDILYAVSFSNESNLRDYPYYLLGNFWVFDHMEMRCKCHGVISLSLCSNKQLQESTFRAN